MESSGEKWTKERKPRRKFLSDTAKIAAGAVSVFSTSSLARNLILSPNGDSSKSSIKATLGEDVGDYQAVFNKDAKKRESIENRVKELIVKHKVSVHKVFSNRAAFDQFISKLDDYSSTYPYQAVAAAELFGEEKRNTSRH